jgi:branched-chain amino acid transport system substrate-binding protein
MNRRDVFGWAMAAVIFGLMSGASAEEPPIKIGMSMPQTGGLAGGGKASLLGIEIWRDDVNAKGGLLDRKVELVVYDDKSSASETPALYAKLWTSTRSIYCLHPMGRCRPRRLCRWSSSAAFC